MKANRIKKADYDRVVVTETVPYETPIIFSTEGLYDNIRASSGGEVHTLLVRAIVLGQAKTGAPSYSIPFSYKIRKDTREYRRLALIHPRAQWRVRKFYEKYERLIIYYCLQSPASIRAPMRVASTFYAKSSWENIRRYKSGVVAITVTDPFTRHSPSFFAYSGYDRLYKFFESIDYFQLEKKFSVLKTLDVTKCFDSIYTHSLSWAVKDKKFTKNHVRESSFAQEFDEVMRHANYNETNGIVIGPEVSRIFAEILFQSVDRRVIERLRKKAGFEFDCDYCLRRYVDDVFIFARDDKTANIVFDTYVEELLLFNLHVNYSKSLDIKRPFVTKKSRVIREVSRAANEFFEKFLEGEDDATKLVPRQVFDKWKLTRSFIETVKSTCAQNEVGYDEVGSYLVSVLSERVKKLVHVRKKDITNDNVEKYRDAILILLEVMYFLYGVAPSVGASYRLCTSVVVLVRFVRMYLVIHNNVICQRIYELTEQLLRGNSISTPSTVEGFVSLEAINVVLAAREMGSDYLFPSEMIEQLFFNEAEPNYFKIVSCLFYVRDDARYSELRNKLDKTLSTKLSNFSDVLEDAEKACLLLDMLSCPYVAEAQKRSWLTRLCADLQEQQPTEAEVQKFLSLSTERHWFIDWAELDMLNSLEKKELKRAY